MAFEKTTVNKLLLSQDTAVALGNTTTTYTAEIDFLHPDNRKANVYVSFYFAASTVSGTNIDVALYGAFSSGGTKVLLKDAVVADITSTAAAVGVLDINQYPAPYYYLGFTTDADETLNTMDVKIVKPGKG